MSPNLKKYGRTIGQNLVIVAKNSLLWSKIPVFMLRIYGRLSFAAPVRGLCCSPVPSGLCKQVYCVLLTFSYICTILEIVLVAVYAGCFQNHQFII